MNEKKYLEIIDADGKTIKYEIIMAFKLAETDKYYVVYTDSLENDVINIYAANYDPFDDTKFEKIATAKEWQIIEAQVRELLPPKNLNFQNQDNYIS